MGALIVRSYKPADRTLDEVHGSGPSFLDRDLEGWRREFMANPNSTAPAFEALCAIVAASLMDEDTGLETDTASKSASPDQTIAVPEWVLNAIFIGWNTYKERRESRTMEQAFGLQPMKPGARSNLATAATKMEDMKIALEVGQIIGPQPERGDVTKAHEIVAEQRGISIDKVEKAWKKNKSLIINGLDQCGSTQD